MKQPEFRMAGRFVRPVTYGLLFGAGACALLLIAFATFMSIQDIPQAVAAVGATATFVVGGFVAGFSSARFAREKGLMLGLCCGIVLFLVLALANLAFDGSGFGIQGFSKLIAVLLAAAIGGVLGVNKKRKFK